MSVAATALALVSAGAPAASADVAQVTVVSPGGSAQTLSLDALAGSEDVVDRAYALRSGDGESSRTVSGFSLAAILDAANADPYGFSYLTVQRPAGGAVLLSRDQALDAGAFPDGPPLVYATAAGTGFLRPSAGPEDLNAGDELEAPQGISIVLHRGSRLRVRARASTPWTRPGRPVRFSAIVEQAGSGEQLTYSWYFDDGGSATGPEATHSFAKRGSYDVVVGVTGEGDETGASAVVTVQVGAPLTGPDRKGGGREDNAAAPDHGSAQGNGSTVGSADGPARKAPSAPAVGERVTGELVSADVSASPKPSGQVPARSGQLQREEGGFGIPGVALGLLATLGLLGAGALLETRRLFG